MPPNSASWTGSRVATIARGMSSRTAAVDEPHEVPFGQTGLLWYGTAAPTAIVREYDVGASS